MFIDNTYRQKTTQLKEQKLQMRHFKNFFQSSAEIKTFKLTQTSTIQIYNC